MLAWWANEAQQTKTHESLAFHLPAERTNADVRASSPAATQER